MARLIACYGGTRRERNRVVFDRAVQRQADFVYLVKSRHRRRQLELIYLEKHPFCFDIPILTFRGLIGLLMEDTGFRPPLSEAARLLLLEEIIHSWKTTRAANAEHSSGLLGRISRGIARLKEQNILDPELLALSSGQRSEGLVSDELVWCFSRYQVRLADLGVEDWWGQQALVYRGLLTGAIRLPDRLAASRSLVVEGFSDMTPVEHSILRHLRDAFDELVVSTDLKPGPADEKESARFNEMRSFLSNPDLEWRSVPAPETRPRVVCLPTAEDEATWVAEKIAGLERQTRPRVAIVSSRPELYRLELTSALAGRGIELAEARGASPAASTNLGLLQDYLKLILERFPRQHLFDFLNHPRLSTGLTSEDLNGIEKWAIACNVREGFRNWSIDFPARVLKALENLPDDSPFSISGILVSPSLLEDYMRCGFRFLAEHCLDLEKESWTQQLDGPELGALLHRVLHRFMKDLEPPGLPDAGNWDRLAAGRLQGLLEAELGSWPLRETRKESLTWTIQEEFLRAGLEPGDAMRGVFSDFLLHQSRWLRHHQVEAGPSRSPLQKRIWSPTELTAFFLCPRRFFLGELLAHPQVNPFGDRMVDPVPSLLGEVVHDVIEKTRNVGDLEEVDRQLKTWEKRMESSLKSSCPDFEYEVRRHLGIVAGSQIYQELQAARRVYREQKFHIRQGDRRLTGVLDALYQREDLSWVVVDFKTVGLRGRSAREVALQRGFMIQVELYLWAAHRILETSELKAVLLFTTSGETVEVDYSSELRERCDEMVDSLPTVVTEEAFPLTTRSGLCQECGFKNRGLCPGVDPSSTVHVPRSTFHGPRLASKPERERELPQRKTRIEKRGTV